MKKLLIALSLAVVLLLAVFLFFKDAVLAPQPTPSELPLATVSKIITIEQLEFSYDASADGYIAVSEEATSSAEVVSSVSLFNRKEFAALQQREVPSEYPPSITLTVYESNTELQPLEWVKANPLASNFELKTGEPTNETVSGVEGISYTVDGLYRMDMYVFAYNSKVYVISGSYFEPTDAIYLDFQELVSSVVFKQ